jgi:hypothetical protein
MDSGCFSPDTIVASWAASGAGEASAARAARQPANAGVDLVDIRPLLIQRIEWILRRYGARVNRSSRKNSMSCRDRPS